MYTFLLVILILDSVVLATVVLMQAGKGGGLAASFGGAGTSATSFLGMRQAGNLLTKVTWWCGGIFLVLSLVLALMSTRTRAPRSILDSQFIEQAPVSAPAGTAPVVPLEPLPQEAPPPQP